MNESQTGTILGGVGIGIGAISLGIIALQLLFKPDENGKRPSVSQVASNLFGSLKTKVSTVENAAVESAKLTIRNDVVEALGDNDPASIILSMAVLPNQVSELPGKGNIQIDEEHLELVQQMLKLMNKPHAVLNKQAATPL